MKKYNIWPEIVCKKVRESYDSLTTKFPKSLPLEFDEL